jgi:hypothetical protein
MSLAGYGKNAARITYPSSGRLTKHRQSYVRFFVGELQDPSDFEGQVFIALHREALNLPAIKYAPTGVAKCVQNPECYEIEVPTLDSPLKIGKQLGVGPSTTLIPRDYEWDIFVKGIVFRWLCIK